MSSNRFVSILILAAVVVWLLPPRQISGQTVPQMVVDEATKSFNQWVERSRTSPEEIRQSWDLDDSHPGLSEGSLENPYVVYQMKVSNVLEFEAGRAEDILSYARVYSYVFPIVAGQQVLGAIKVGNNRSEDGELIHPDGGEYRYFGWHSSGDYRDEIVLELRDKFAKKDGYTISYLVAHQMGIFMVISKHGRAEFITPITPVGAKLLFVEEGNKRGRYPLVPTASAEPMLKNGVSRIRARKESNNGQRQ